MSEQDNATKLRKLWSDYHETRARQFAEWASRHYSHQPPEHLPFPECLRGWPAENPRRHSMQAAQPTLPLT